MIIKYKNYWIKNNIKKYNQIILNKIKPKK